eukprot:1157862-Pelagomonas_calceolata.AAC.12
MARLEHNYREDTIMIKEMGRAINSLTAKQGPKTKRVDWRLMSEPGNSRLKKSQVITPGSARQPQVMSSKLMACKEL